VLDRELELVGIAGDGRRCGEVELQAYGIPGVDSVSKVATAALTTVCSSTRSTSGTRRPHSKARPKQSRFSAVTCR